MRLRIVTAAIVLSFVLAAAQGAQSATARKPVNGTSHAGQPVRQKIIVKQNQNNFWGRGWGRGRGWCYWHPYACYYRNR